MLRLPSDIKQVQWPAFAFAFDNRRIVHQFRETRAIECCRHRHQTKIGPKRRLCLQRQRQAEIAIQTALVHLVEQNRRYARKFGIGDNAVTEYALRQHQDPGCCGLFAVHAGGISDRPPDRFAHQFGDALRRHSGRQSAG